MSTACVWRVSRQKNTNSSNCGCPTVQSWGHNGLFRSRQIRADVRQTTRTFMLKPPRLCISIKIVSFKKNNKVLLAWLTEMCFCKHIKRYLYHILYFAEWLHLSWRYFNTQACGHKQRAAKVTAWPYMAAELIYTYSCGSICCCHVWTTRAGYVCWLFCGHYVEIWACSREPVTFALQRLCCVFFLIIIIFYFLMKREVF